jgi:hypothetical protein
MGVGVAASLGSAEHCRTDVTIAACERVRARAALTPRPPCCLACWGHRVCRLRCRANIMEAVRRFKEVYGGKDN